MNISGDFGSIEEVKQLCISSLPSFQIPAEIKIMAELPKNESGKIIRQRPKIERETNYD